MSTSTAIQKTLKGIVTDVLKCPSNHEKVHNSRVLNKIRYKGFSYKNEKTEIKTYY